MSGRNFLLLFGAFIYFGLLSGSQSRLSSQSKISLLTCAPGTEIYSVFGHSCIRVNDPSRNLDIVFNYGTFDFHEKNFYLKFLQGNMLYYLSIQKYKDFKKYYTWNNQSVIEQELNLNHQQKLAIFDHLKNDYQMSNRYYTYHYFKNNCSTKIRDILYENSEPPQTYFQTSEDSYRSLVNHYLSEKPWVNLAANLALGKKADSLITVSNAMFIPDKLAIALDTWYLPTGKSNDQFVLQKQNIIDGVISAGNSGPVKYGFSFLIALLILFTIIQIRLHIDFLWIDRVLFMIIGIIGLVLFYMGIFSHHSYSSENLNILLINPAFVLLAITIGKFRLKRFNIILVRMLIGVIVLFFILKVFSSQVFPDEINWIFFIILTRLLYLHYYYNKKAVNATVQFNKNSN